MNASIYIRKIISVNKNGRLNHRVLSFLELDGGKLMEKANSYKYEPVKLEGSFIKAFLVGISERSEIFYNKYLRSKVAYDYLEVKRIRERNINNGLWDTIRNQ